MARAIRGKLRLRGRARTVAGPFLAISAMLLVLVSPTASPQQPWKYIVFEHGAFVWRDAVRETYGAIPSVDHRTWPRLATSGDVAASVLADVTGGGTLDWILLVWRPWKDWPIQDWLPAPSPIAGFHDAAGDSCQLMLIDSGTGREIWVGSALPAPLLALAVGDVDGDGLNEVVTLEGDYDSGRGGRARRVDIWSWEGFGFSLEWRSAPVWVRELHLFGDPHGGILTIGVR